MNDRYMQMKNVEVGVDFADAVGKLCFRKHSFGIGGVNPAPMPDKVAKGTQKLRPGMLRIFIQEFFFIERADGSLDFSALDKYMRAINATGADIMASICIKPPSVYPDVDENIWKPSDVGMWQHIIGEMARRYSVDNKYVTHWGVANEINIGEWGGCPYKIDSAADYFEYYKMTVEPILRVFPEAKVGGPSWAGAPGDDCCRFFDEFLALCADNNVQVDFISYNVYSDSPDAHISGALRARETADRHDGKLEIYVTELNVDLGGLSIEERAYTPHRAAGLGAILHEFHKRAESIGTFQYHIYDQFCDPRQFAPFYARTRYMAEHWSDSAHRLGLFDEHGTPRPQYFMYAMLYAMAENEVAAAFEGCANLRVMASHNDRYNTVFLTNYNPGGADDLTLSFKFRNAREGRTNMKVYRIDEDRMWDDDSFELIPVENRTVYWHHDFHCDIYAPADSTIMLVFDYDA